MAAKDYKINNTSISDIAVIADTGSRKGIKWFTVPTGTYFEGLTFTNSTGTNSGYAVLKESDWPISASAIRGYSITKDNDVYRILHNSSTNIALEACCPDDAYVDYQQWTNEINILKGNSQAYISAECVVLFKTSDNYLARAKATWNYDHDFVGPSNVATQVTLSEFKSLVKPSNGVVGFYATGGGGGGGRGQYFNDDFLIKRGGGGGGGGSAASAVGYLEMTYARKYKDITEVQTEMNTWLQAKFNGDTTDSYDSDILVIWLGSIASGGSEGDGDDGGTTKIEYFTYPTPLITLGGGKGGEGASKDKTTTPAAGGAGGTYSGDFYIPPNIYWTPSLKLVDVHAFDGAAGGSGMVSSTSYRTQAGTIDPLTNFAQAGYSINNFGGYNTSLFPATNDKDRGAPPGYCFFPQTYGGDGGNGGKGGLVDNPDGVFGSSGEFYVYEL